jgi:hypothetical protein
MSRVRTLALPLLLVLMLLPLTGAAQGVPQVSSIEIAIWPEYDQPAALVIYQVRLAEDVKTPAIVTVPIPAEVGDPHAVAAWYPDGSLDDNVTWSSSRQGDWSLITVTTDTSGIWLEFYDELTIEGDKRSYAFTWPGDLATDSLTFEVLHPVGAREVRVTPEGEVIQGATGLTYTQVNLGARTAEQIFSIELSYTKSTTFAGSTPQFRLNPALAQFEVALWPEYDQASTLVIYQGSISPEESLPATIAIPLPASVGEPSAVATLGSDNRLYLTEFEREVVGDWAWVTFETESSAFQVEYYDDLFFDGTTRSFTFSWPGSIGIGSFSYELQQPFGASGLQVIPAGVVQPDANGLVYVRADLGPLQTSSPLTISFQYEKATGELTANAVAAAPSIDRPATTQGGTPDLGPQLPYILGGFGFLLIALGIFLYLRFQRQEKASQKRPRTRRKKSKSQRNVADLDAAAVFCHVCGTKASASDHFCRNCGTKLRT